MADVGLARPHGHLRTLGQVLLDRRRGIRLGLEEGWRLQLRLFFPSAAGLCNL